MKSEQILSFDPSAEEVAKKAARLPVDKQTLAEVRRLLEATVMPDAEIPWPPILRHAKERADSRSVSPATTHRGLIGLPLVAAKRAFRAVFQPFINEVLRKQVEFNEAMVAAALQLYESQQQGARDQALWRDELSRRVSELEERLRKPPVERKGKRP
ncbi:MAG: hypothetical protein ACOZIN_10835 [Myxococcota bacterium]